MIVIKYLNGKPFVYLDNAATTQPDPKVIQIIQDYLTDKFYNPSSTYEQAESVRTDIENCRNIISASIGAKPNEIYFTSGGSESDNTALKGLLHKGDHLITSAIEHKAILNTCKYLEKQGVEVTYLNVTPFGKIYLNELENAIKPNTKLISIMAVNNEIGSIQDLLSISKIAKQNNVLFHSDAVQIYGKAKIDVNYYGIDLLSASSHKLHGLKGTGFLYIKEGIDIDSLIHGGEQENYFRGGTENVIGIMALAKASELCKDYNDRWDYLQSLNDAFIETMYESNIQLSNYKLAKDCDGFFLKSQTPYIISMCFPDIRGEQIVRLMDANGICISTGSACNSHSANPSHVLKAIGFSDEEANGTIRISLSDYNTYEEMEYAARTLVRIIKQLKRKE